MVGCEPRVIKNTHQLPLYGVRLHSYNTPNRTIWYARYGSESGKPVLFIHGSPGSWADFKSVMADKRLAEQYCMVAVDRPGWGRSGGEVEPSLQRSAELLLPATAVCSNRKPPILVGYSLGGPIAARLAADYPNRISGLLLISPSIDPDLRPVRWFNRAAEHVAIRALIGDMLARSNDEILPLEDELRQLALLLPHITAPVMVLQGDKDGLVDPANALYMQKMLPSQSLRIRILKNTGHLVPFEEPESVATALLALDASAHIPFETSGPQQLKTR